MKRRGIRKRAVFAVAFLLVVSFFLLGAALSALIYLYEKEELVDMQTEIVGYAANEMRWDIHELESVLGLAASNYDRSRRNGSSDSGFVSQILMSEHVKRHNIIDELSFVDESGHELVRVSRTWVYNRSDLRDFSGRDEFTVPKKSGTVYLGPVTFDSATFAPYMSISVPVQDVRSGLVKAMLIGNIRVHRIWENAVERSIGRTGNIFITDETGKVLAHPDPSVIFRNTHFRTATPIGLQKGIHGERVMLFAKKTEIANRTFYVYASMPFLEVLSLSFRTLFVMAIFLSFFVVLSILLCLAALNRIIRPVETLADSARRISAGELPEPVLVSDGDEIGDMSNAFNLMTSRLLESINTLEARNELLNNIMKSLTHPFYVIDAADYSIKLANPAAGFAGLSPDMTCYELTHNRNSPCSEDEHPCVIDLIKQKKGPVVVEHLHHDEAGNQTVVEIHGYPIFDSGHDVVQVIEYVFDITARKKMEEELFASELKNRTITSTAKDAIIMMDENGLTYFWNPAAEKIFGYKQDEVINSPLYRFVVPERSMEAFNNAVSGSVEKGEDAAAGRTTELVARRKDGTEFEAELSLSSIRLRDVRYAVGIVRDITQRKLAEKKLLLNLEEKELLLQEIHHRVKNNMQVISSLLDLQLGYIEGRPPSEVFSEIKNRIRSMSLVHEKLYHSGDLSRVDFRDYAVSLVSNLYRFYGISVERIRLSLEIEETFFGIDTAIPCGLILNELVTNVLKYAFPEGRAGLIGIRLSRIAEGGYELVVRDNGIGLPDNIDLNEIRTMGLYLIKTLVEHQLQGTLALDRVGGTGFNIRFRELKYKKRV